MFSSWFKMVRRARIERAPPDFSVGCNDLICRQARAGLRRAVAAGAAWNIRTSFAFRIMAFRELLTLFGTWSAHPLAFAIVAVYALAWLTLSPETFGWHGLATVATWM